MWWSFHWTGDRRGLFGLRERSRAGGEEVGVRDGVGRWEDVGAVEWVLMKSFLGIEELK